MKKLKLKRWVKVTLLFGGLIALYNLLGDNELMNMIIFISMGIYAVLYEMLEVK